MDEALAAAAAEVCGQPVQEAGVGGGAVVDGQLDAAPKRGAVSLVESSENDFN